VQRVDDEAHTIRVRLQSYKDATEPLVSYYRGRGLLRTIDGVGTMDEVFERIQNAIAVGTNSN
jgi:adenylate kinase